MARLTRARPDTGEVILVVDDDADFVRSMQSLLERQGHSVLSTHDPQQGVELVRSERPCLVLLDYVMPEMNGAAFVSRIREFDLIVQVLLVTGYADEQPGRKLLRDLDIQDYHDKGDGPERLLVQIDATLKKYHVLARLERRQRALVSMLASGRALMQLQAFEETCRQAVERFSAVVLSTVSGVSGSSSGWLVVHDPVEGVRFCAGIGRFAEYESIHDMPATMANEVRSVLASDRRCVRTETSLMHLLEGRGPDRGAIYIESERVEDVDLDIIELYTQQVVQAIENARLYERATHDPRTGLWNRSYGFERLDAVLRLGSWSGSPTAVIAIDVDHFKHVNDSFGHPAGDRVLCHLADVLQRTSRSSDVVCRLGGDEFLVILPDTGDSGAATFAEKLRAAVSATALSLGEQLVTITVSTGIAVAASGMWTVETAPTLLGRADDRLYAAKAEGRNRVATTTSAEAPA